MTNYNDTKSDHNFFTDPSMNQSFREHQSLRAHRSFREHQSCRAHQSLRAHRGFRAHRSFRALLRPKFCKHSGTTFDIVVPFSYNLPNSTSNLYFSGRKMEEDHAAIFEMAEDLLSKYAKLCQHALRIASALEGRAGHLGFVVLYIVVPKATFRQISQ